MTNVATIALPAELPLEPRESTTPGRLSTAWYWIRGSVEILLVALAFPVALLLIGLPVALLVRAIIELVSWL
jgi:hypothetical protein